MRLWDEVVSHILLLKGIGAPKSNSFLLVPTQISYVFSQQYIKYSTAFELCCGGPLNRVFADLRLVETDWNTRGLKFVIFNSTTSDSMVV